MAEKSIRASTVSAFITAKGSTYVVHPDGTTTRNKAQRPGLHHEGSFGPQTRSVKTYYLDPNHRDRLITPSRRRYVDHQNGTISLAPEVDGKFTYSLTKYLIPVQEVPKIGLLPIEFWDRDPTCPVLAYSSIHIGNVIVSVS